VYLPAADDDIPEIVRLTNRAYRGSGGSSGWSHEEAYLAGDRTTEARLRADILANPSAVLLKWVDEPNGRFSGSVWLEPAGGEAWYLGSLAIDPDRQNGGLGRAMLAAAEDWIRKGGGKRVRMKVINVREALIAWYIRRGYSRTGAIDPFPYGDDSFGRPLRDDLCFVVFEKTF
jgi:ribosomal protein S18 acetylase RimI-like enzyme